MAGVVIAFMIHVRKESGGPGSATTPAQGNHECDLFMRLLVEAPMTVRLLPADSCQHPQHWGL